MNSEYAVSRVNTNGLLDRLRSNIDSFFESIDHEAIEDLVFFFPPYSALYWCNAQDRGYFDDFMAAKRYFISKAGCINANVYDFQDVEFITALDNYKDTTHYSPVINDWMVKCFARKINTTNSGIAKERQIKLEERIADFRERYKDLFERVSN